MMGGCFNKIGMFASMGLVALRKVRFELEKDHEMGKLLGKRMQDLGWIKIIQDIDVHMIFFRFKDKRVDPNKLKDFLL